MAPCTCGSTRRELLLTAVAGSAAGLATALVPTGLATLAAGSATAPDLRTAFQSDEHLTFDQVVTTPEGTPLGGDVHVEVYRDGRTYVKFHMHSSSVFESFDFNLRAYVSAAGFPTLAFLHSGHVSGVDSADYDEWGYNALITPYYDALASGPLYSVGKDYTWGGIVGGLKELVDDLLDIGAGAIGASLGAIIGATREALGWLGTSLGTGGTLGVIGGVVIFSVGVIAGGPIGASLVAAVVTGVEIGAVVDALVDQRPISDAEIAFARQVFGDNIPWGNLMLTNLAGVGGRAFTAPGVDGKTYLNLGSGYDDPVNYTSNPYPYPGQMLIHELTHAWQIAKAAFIPGWMCSALVNQANNSFVDSVYKYGAPGLDWGQANFEQQGAIVDQWFGGNGNSTNFWPMDQENPYYPYIYYNLLGRNVSPTEPGNLRTSSGIAVCRVPSHIDVFYPQPGGSVGSVWWDANQNDANWNPAFTVAGPNVASAGPIASLGRLPDHVDLFWAGPDGAVNSAWWGNDGSGNYTWSPLFAVAGAGTAMPTTVAATCQIQNHIDVFWTGADGSAGSTYWDGDWHPPFPIAPAGSAAGGMAALARKPGHLDVFWVTPDGALASTWWDAAANNAAWYSVFTLTGSGAALPNTVAVVSRVPEHLDVFFVAPDGSVQSVWWDGGFNNAAWNAPFSVAPAGSAAGGISVVSRTPEHIDVFWVAPDGSIASAWWDGVPTNPTWYPPFAIAGPGSAAATSPITAVGRLPLHLDVFWIAPDGSIGSVWWDAFANNAAWSAPFTAAGAGSALVG